ncbi:MAG: hypothetical protein ACR2NU_10635 [Aeoliella sp.]
MKIPPAVYGVNFVIGLALVAIGTSKNNSIALVSGIVFIIGAAIAAFASRNKSHDTEQQDGD